MVLVRVMRKDDIERLHDAFNKQGWNKPMELFEGYYNEQLNNERLVLIAEMNEELAGYSTICWKSEYIPFLENNIPEIKDLNTLINFRNQGVATSLMDFSEMIIRQKYSTVGIGVGMYKDYGMAQRMYIKRGYLPDGLGITYNYRTLEYNDVVTNDDDLVLFFTKTL